MTWHINLYDLDFVNVPLAIHDCQSNKGQHYPFIADFLK